MAARKPTSCRSAVRLVENQFAEAGFAPHGATVAELEAIFGWQGGGMAALYTRAADRARLAKGAMSKMAKGTTSEHSIPSPNHQVMESARKEK